MGTLDRVIEMQRQGLPDSEIALRLQNAGVSAKEIYESLSHAKIKNAVSPPEGDPLMDSQPVQRGFSNQQSQNDMQPSIMGQSNQFQATMPVAGGNQPQPEMYPPEEGYQQPVNQNYYPETPQSYPEQQVAYPEGYYGQQPVDTETISEVAEQVASEKINEFKRQVGDLVTFRNIVNDRLEDLEERLRRIEANIDKLQSAVVGKIGEFGESSALMHRDLENLHNTFSKMMNPLMDNYNELKKLKDKDKSKFS